MIKISIAIFLQLFLWNHSFGQVLSNETTYPFQMKTLEMLSYRKDSIMPKYDGNRFFYINTKTNKRIGTKTFELAYPHNEFPYAIVKHSGQFGIVDRNGEFKIDPKCDTIQLSGKMSTGYQMECFIGYPRKKKKIKLFNLHTGELSDPFIDCGFPVRPSYYIFKGVNGKYGIKEEYRANNRSREKVIFKSVFDTVYKIENNGLAITQKRGKIGVVYAKTKQVALKFQYRNFILGNRYLLQTDSGWVEQQYLGVDSFGVWKYYNLKKAPELMLTSTYQCIKLGGMKIKNGIGIVERNGKYNVLLANGNLLNEDYDYLSSDGGIATSDKKVYLFDKEGKRYLYCY